MKKLFFTLMGIAAVAAVACQPKEEAEIANGHRISVTLTAAQPETKTYIEEVQGGWQPYWSADDAIVVTNTADFETESPKDNPFVNQSGAGINASFTGSIVAEDGEVTVHAYRPKRSNRSKGIFKFAIPATQAVPSLTTFNPDYDLLVADPLTLTVANQTVTSADPLHFHRLVSVVRIIAKDNTKAGALAGKSIKSARFTADGVTLCGELGVDIKAIQVEKWYDKATPIASYVEATYEGTDWTADGTTGAYVLTGPATIPAGTSISLKLTLSDDSEVLVSRVASGEINLQSAKVTTLKFNVTDSDLNAEEPQSTVWNFSEDAWQTEFKKLGSAGAELSAVNLTYAGLTIKGDAKSKYNTTYFQTTGTGSTEANFFKFTASEDGLVTVNESHTGSTAPDPIRYICVYNNGAEQRIEGSVNSKNPKNCCFNVVAGDVYIYGTGGARYYTIKFEAGKSITPTDPDDPTTPDETQAELEIPADFKPVTGTVDPTILYGYAEGVTGGDNATPANVLHFDNGKALQTWLLNRTKSEKKGDNSPVTIWLSGTFGPGDGRDFSEAHPWFDVKDVSNLSFYGTDGFVMDRIGIFCVRANNIIIRNINFQQPKASNGADAVSMQECDGVWVDHCTFTSLNQTKDYEDGSTDVTHGSHNVTVSWCHYIKTQKSCLVGHSNNQSSDVSITATFHHNWFDGSSSRHPRVRYGRAHVYNNLFDGCTTYGVGSAYGAKVLVEYNYFDGVQLPTDICTYPAKESNESNLQGSVAGYLFAGEDILVNRPAKAKDPYPLTNLKYKSYNGETLSTTLTYADFKPAYDYTVTPAADVPEAVKANAGYGKLGWTEAPVAVNNGDITEFNGTDDDPVDPDPGTGEDPGQAAGLAEGWSWINNGAATATYGVSDGKLTITASGKWEGSGQAFGYAFREVTGDFTATVKIDSYASGKGADSNQGVAGLLVVFGDPSATANSLIFAISGKSNDKFYRRYRNSGSNSTSSAMSAPETSGSNAVVRLVREGDKIKCSYSLDGGTTFGSVSAIDFTGAAGSVKIGVACNSADNAKTGTAVFSNFTLNGTEIAF